MTNLTSATIEILGKPYVIRCDESQLKSLQQAALLLNQKMQEVKDSGKVMNMESIAIITSLNLAHQLLAQDQDNHSLISKINQRIAQMQNKLDTAVNNIMQTELVYSSE